MKTPILLLHGWSHTMTGDRYSELARILTKRGYDVFVPDLPGFGQEPLVRDAMDLDDYVEWVVAFLKKRNVKHVIVIGHSFGGRIAARLAYLYPKAVEELVLTGAPLVKVPLSFKKQFLSRVVRLTKGLMGKIPLPMQDFLRKGLYYWIGEWDYYKAGHLKETFKKIVAQDISDILETISVPTLIVWGSRDSFVPVLVGKQIAAKIPGSTLVIVPNGTHSLPYAQPALFADEVLQWLHQ